MKSIIKFVILGILGLSFLRCSEEEDVVNQPTPNTLNTTVNFSLETHTLEEAGEPLKVNLTFDRPASVNGSFVIRLSGDAVYQQHYNTTPAASQSIITLSIEKGQSNAHFMLNPVNDEDSVGNQTIALALENPSNGFKLGNKVTSSVELLEDDAEEPGNGEEDATVEFAESFVHISETDIAGFEIDMLLQGTVAHTEFVNIDIVPTDGFEYGTDYVTDPVAVQNTFKLEINPGVENLKFRIIPVNDNELSGTFELKLSFANISDGIKAGSQTTMTIKVEEDDIIDPLEINTIAALRTLFENYEGDWYLPNDYYIEGIVTSEKNVADEKAIYIQDATGGIMLVFNGPVLLNKGDKVQLNLKNAVGAVANGQKAMMGVEDRAGIILGRNFAVDPEVITIEQLNSGDYQGKRVRILNVSFTESGGIDTWQGDHMFTDGERNGVAKSYPFADFSNVVIPTEKVNITGIVGDWNRIQPQNYQQDVIIVIQQ